MENNTETPDMTMELDEFEFESTHTIRRRGAEITADNIDDLAGLFEDGEVLEDEERGRFLVATITIDHQPYRVVGTDGDWVAAEPYRRHQYTLYLADSYYGRQFARQAAAQSAGGQ